MKRLKRENRTTFAVLCSAFLISAQICLTLSQPDLTFHEEKQKFSVKRPFAALWLL